MTRPIKPARIDYAGRPIALLTRHGKERVIAPALEPALGCRVELVTGYDTDRLGTFTREIPRAGSQLEAARRKARIGMELSGLSLGLASEGAFGPDPMAGLFPWNVEIVVFIDDEAGIEIVGRAQGPARHAHLSSGEWAAAEDLAARLASRCPACGAPGFWLDERLAGLPCGDCGAPTREARAEVHGCVRCAQRATRGRTAPKHADPGRCDFCNP